MGISSAQPPRRASSALESSVSSPSPSPGPSHGAQRSPLRSDRSAARCARHCPPCGDPRDGEGDETEREHDGARARFQPRSALRRARRTAPDPIQSARGAIPHRRLRSAFGAVHDRSRRRPSAPRAEPPPILTLAFRMAPVSGWAKRSDPIPAYRALPSASGWTAKCGGILYVQPLAGVFLPRVFKGVLVALVQHPKTQGSIPCAHSQKHKIISLKVLFHKQLFIFYYKYALYQERLIMARKTSRQVEGQVEGTLPPGPPGENLSVGGTKQGVIGKPPPRSERLWQIVKNICTGKYPFAPPSLPKEAISETENYRNFKPAESQQGTTYGKNQAVYQPRNLPASRKSSGEITR